MKAEVCRRSTSTSEGGGGSNPRPTPGWRPPSRWHEAHRSRKRAAPGPLPWDPAARGSAGRPAVLSASGGSPAGAPPHPPSDGPGSRAYPRGPPRSAAGGNPVNAARPRPATRGRPPGQFPPADDRLRRRPQRGPARSPAGRSSSASGRAPAWGSTAKGRAPGKAKHPGIPAPRGSPAGPSGAIGLLPGGSVDGPFVRPAVKIRCLICGGLASGSPEPAAPPAGLFRYHRR